MIPKPQLSSYDIIGFIADIQTSYTDNFKKLQGMYGWKVPDARLQVFFNCLEVAANARLGMGLLAFARANGLGGKDWWGKWACYDEDRAFNNLPDFGTFVDDKCRQFAHRTQEQLLVSVQIYTEAFLRSLARQFRIDRKQFWQLKKDFLQDVLGFGTHDIEPLTVYQHLRNSLHNKGLHYNNNYPRLAFDINGYNFGFTHGQAVKISWEHVRELQIATSNLLLKINEHSKVNCLPNFNEENVVIITDE
ncbi:MAG: hypothetical protein ACHQ7N_14955 [Candidatus Methylomirabilales bacterium]